jgi:hypothetical protein
MKKFILLALLLAPACFAQKTLCYQLVQSTGIPAYLPCPGGTGTQGPAGPEGATGPAGPQGLQGTPGTTGPVGPTGATGATGPQGSTGTPGAQGPQGVAGPAGPQGPPGAGGSVAWTNENLSYSSTPTFSTGTITSHIPLSGNMTPQIAAGTDGQFKCLNFVHDSTSNHYTVTEPSNMVGLFAPGLKHNQQCFIYYVADGLWEAFGPGVIQQ